MRPLLSFFAVLALGAAAVHACPPAPCYRAPYRAPVVHEAPYVAPVVAAVFVPIAVPSYGVSFQPGYAIPPALVSAPPSTAAPSNGGPQPGLNPPATLPGVAPATAPVAATAPPAGAESRLDRLERENAELRQRLGETPAPGAGQLDYVPTQAGDKTATSPGLDLIGRFCVRCHSAEAAKEKGKGLVLVRDNRLVPLTEALKRKAFDLVSSGAMPKGATLSDREVGQVLDVFAGKTSSPPSPAQSGVNP